MRAQFRIARSMPKDFAGRGRKNTKKSVKRKPAKRVNPNHRVLFHGPSFCAGALVGAAIVILAAYGPEFFQVDSVVDTPTSEARTAEPRLEFEFPDLLKKTEVKPDPEPYAVPQTAPGDVPTSYSIQAASFRDKADAERLRGSLLLEDLPAKTTSIKVGGQLWYRVIVGPYAKGVEADRAINRLRELNLSAIRLNNHN
jgi:cell division protein FtsN